MKATIEFNLPEEQDEFKQSVNATSLAFVLWKFIYNGHRELKHKDIPSSYYDGFVAAQKQVREALEEEGIIIDTIIT